MLTRLTKPLGDQDARCRRHSPARHVTAARLPGRVDIPHSTYLHPARLLAPSRQRYGAIQTQVLDIGADHSRYLPVRRCLGAVASPGGKRIVTSDSHGGRRGAGMGAVNRRQVVV